MQRKGGKKEDHAIDNAPYTTVDKDGRVVWEPGLPAMVTSRRQPRPQKRMEVEEQLLSCDLKATLKMTSEAKPDWLYKALKGIPKGKAQLQDVYNIVTHPKFASGVKEWHGQRMLRMLQDHVELFSEKQRSTLVLKCELAQRFRSPTPTRSRSRGSRRSRSRSKGKTPMLGSLDEDELLRLGTTAEEAAAVDASTAASSSTADATKDDARESSTSHPEVSQEERERALREQRLKMLDAFRAREAQREDERIRVEADRRRFQEREQVRKAKLGGAFTLDDAEDDRRGTVVPQAYARSRPSAEDRTPLGVGVGTLPGTAEPTSLALVGSSQSRQSNSQFVEAMGGDKVLHEVHALLLQKVAPENRALPGAARNPRERSASRSRDRRRSRSRDRRYREVTSGAFRSPTPDGRARGQARAARKAKMIASCLGLGAGPRGSLA